ncbi:HipA N-terminal domain protein [uncultured Desulfobacterium sp.]|uniref:HipA N-terminal domain protein n=1 Tax=uncultured Desulfobacterium sp. TaxID=201089 RepID=A0A445N2G7_9BACT|nr:HipA N-terminal domain protein [uncultured Desulfobacterium sp.]
MPDVSSLAVWVADTRAGILAREQRQEYVFAYSPGSEAGSQVSLTMPVRLQSWVSRDLHPIFQMNLPEGALLEAIRRAIAKVIGADSLTILKVTGGNQVGRNRFSLPDEESPHSAEHPESLEQLLTYPDTKDLFHELVNKYALRSGISGVQPKVLLEATERATLASSCYIVKSWGTDYPGLAANEYFCMTAARRAGLPTPEFFLSDNGGLFIMRRFDIAPDGAFIGFEDMCSLQALGTAQKYLSSYERVAKSIRDFVSGEHLLKAREQFFSTLVLSVMVRNGDAHLKNFGVLYSSTPGTVTIAPVYDVVTTTAYIKNDVPALSLAGTKKWWLRKILERFAISYLSLPPALVSITFSRLADAVTETRQLIPGYIADHPDFRETGERMMAEWDQGVNGLIE